MVAVAGSAAGFAAAGWIVEPTTTPERAAVARRLVARKARPVRDGLCADSE
jgi:hypothetical protein